jgi:6,7-dimethyl-8-ribityllumazine synthase
VGAVRFASPNATGDLNGTLTSFVMLNLNDFDLGLLGEAGGVVAADFANMATFFDLIADGTSNASSATTLAALAPADTEGSTEPGGVALSASERRRLEALLGGSIEIRLPEVAEILEIGRGSVAFRDHGRNEVAALAAGSDVESVAARGGDWRRPLPAVVQRFAGARVRELLATSDALSSMPRAALSSAAGAIAELDAAGVGYERIVVPGALEIPQVLAQAVAAGVIPAGSATARYVGAVALGCVIRGETSHYDIVCNNANHWLMDVAIRHQVPVGNAILTVDTDEQAHARTREKGADAARVAIEMANLGASLASLAPDDDDDE